jgi:hypothetical protein
MRRDSSESVVAVLLSVAAVDCCWGEGREGEEADLLPSKDLEQYLGKYYWGLV